mgnify:CR=1 FL=1
MAVKQYDNTKTTLVFETKTHRFTINDEKLEELKEKQNWKMKLVKKIQKSLKQTIDHSSGEYWDSSVKEIYNAITGESNEQ